MSRRIMPAVLGVGAVLAAPTAVGAQQPYQHAPQPTAAGKGGAVATADGVATNAALRVLRRGGNAVDAAVAVAATLAVVEPFMSGPGGGGGYMLIREGKSGTLHGLDYMGWAPRAARAETWSDQEEVYSDVRSAIVPGPVGGWLAALERFGTMDRAAVFRPAIETAERGWPVTDFGAATLAEQAERMGRFASSRAVFYPNGRPPRAGELVPEPDLARSYRAIVEGGAEAFYRGQLGERLVRAVQEAGGWLTMEDLADFRVAWRQPLAVEYRGARVATLPAPCSGLQYLESLKILEGFDVVELGHNSADYLHLLLETVKLASADRTRFTLDAEVPAEALLDPGYAAERRALIDRERAAPSEGERYRASKDGLVAPGDPRRYRRDHTTHFEAADRRGNLVSVTQSNGGAWGCGLVAGDTGITLNNFLYWQDIDPASPNHLRPGAAMECPMAPCIVTRDGRPLLGIGTPGSYGILQMTLQMLLNHLDFGLNVQAAIEAPRVRAFERTLVDAEARIPPDALAGLHARGHEVNLLEDWTSKVGGGQGIAIDPESGVFSGGADPRRDGMALGW
jgi:gamma-glutamyltranspeptidase / glutathione hydrolase